MLETDLLLARLVGELRLLCTSEESLIVSYNPVGSMSMFKPSNELEAGSKAADGIKMGASLGAARFIRNELLLYQGKDGGSATTEWFDQGGIRHTRLKCETTEGNVREGKGQGMCSDCERRTKATSDNTHSPQLGTWGETISTWMRR